MKEELSLVILLSNPAPDELVLKRIEHILKKNINWYTVFYISLKERTTYLICENLLHYHYFWMVPDYLRIVWDTAYIGNIKRNKQLLHYYEIFKNKFSENGIWTMPGNGIMLLCSVFQDMLGVRLLHDIDFFTQKKYLEAIDTLMHSLDFKKIYINDKDRLSNLSQISEYSVLYSKYTFSTYINCDFCCCTKENPALYDWLIDNINHNQTMGYDFMQLIMLYLSADKSWNGHYFANNVKHYTYSRLLDIYLYKKKYANFNIRELLHVVPDGTALIKKMHDIDNALNFFKKEGYLT